MFLSIIQFGGAEGLRLLFIHIRFSFILFILFLSRFNFLFTVALVLYICTVFNYFKLESSEVDGVV